MRGNYYPKAGCKAIPIDLIERNRARGRISLRRLQMKLIEKGNAPMAIWLGKPWLNQRDVLPIELSGPESEQLRISAEAINAILDTED